MCPHQEAWTKYVDIVLKYGPGLGFLIAVGQVFVICDRYIDPGKTTEL